VAAKPDCVFCKIVQGEIPSHRVFENDAVLAFMDIGPLAEGHLLVIPKAHYQTIDQMSAEHAAELGRVLPQLTGVVQQVSGATGCNLLQNNGVVAGQAVLHVHFHIIPRAAQDGLGYRWHPKSYPDGRAAELATLMSTALGRSA
jgi:histidine triad (HIT) family protein